MRQTRHSTDSEAGFSRVSPQQAQTVSARDANSAQQDGQTGTRENCGMGKPQRTQGAGSKAQPSASSGLRSTRTTARQRDEPEGRATSGRESERLWKTHLTCSQRHSYARLLTVSIRALLLRFHGNRVRKAAIFSGLLHAPQRRAPKKQNREACCGLAVLLQTIGAKRHPPDRLRLRGFFLISSHRLPTPPAKA